MLGSNTSKLDLLIVSIRGDGRYLHDICSISVVKSLNLLERHGFKWSIWSQMIVIEKSTCCPYLPGILGTINEEAKFSIIKPFPIDSCALVRNRKYCYRDTQSYVSIATETLFKHLLGQSDHEDNRSIWSTFFPVQEVVTYQPIVDLWSLPAPWWEANTPPTFCCCLRSSYLWSLVPNQRSDIHWWTTRLATS